MPILTTVGMEGLINYRNEGLLKELAGELMHCNTVWGTDYFMMDSPAFMGKTGGEQYDVIIDMFIKLWYTQKCRVNKAIFDFSD